MGKDRVTGVMVAAVTLLLGLSVVVLKGSLLTNYYY